MFDFYSTDRNDLESYCQSRDLALVHVNTLLRAAYKHQHFKPWEVESSSYPQKLKTQMAQDFFVTQLRAASTAQSRYDGSVKFALQLEDGRQIETVLMPEKKRITLCVSSQVGCAQACSFCHTGRMGLTRNLTAGEIVGQVVFANQWIADHPQWLKQNQLTRPLSKLRHLEKVTNIVFMGMGEPLDNCDAVIKAVRIMLEPMGLNLGMRKISLSTAGHLLGLEKFREVFPDIPIALSLHSANAGLRGKLMPITERWSMLELIDAIKKITASSRRSVLIQYTLIAGVNDRLQDAEELAQLLAGLRVKINLIPFNEIFPSRFRSPSSESVTNFKDCLHKHGFRVMIRFSNGQDIQAGCGQLVS